MTAGTQRIPVKLLLGIGFGMFLGVLSANSIPVMIGALIDGLAMTEAEVGVLGTVELLAVALGALAATPMAGKVSNRRLAVFGCLLAITAQFLSACRGQSVPAGRFAGYRRRRARPGLCGRSHGCRSDREP